MACRRSCERWPGRVYRDCAAAGRVPPAILLLRAEDIQADAVGDILSEAGLS